MVSEEGFNNKNDHSGKDEDDEVSSSSSSFNGGPD
jgi:hypothetical protein